MHLTDLDSPPPSTAAMRQIRAFGNVAPKEEGKKGKKSATAGIVDKKDKQPPAGAETTDCCICEGRIL